MKKKVCKNIGTSSWNLGDTFELESLLRNALKLAIDQLSANCVFIILINDLGEIDFQIGQEEKSNTSIELEDKIKLRILENVIDGGKPLIFDETSNLINPENVSDLQTDYAISIPLIAQDRTLGVIYIEKNVEKTFSWDDDFAKMKNFASHFAEAINKILPIKRTEGELIKSRQYVEFANTMVLAFNEKSEITILNKKGYEILGYDQGSLLGKNWFEICVPEYIRDEMLTAYEKTLVNGVTSEYFEYPILTRTGDIRLIGWKNNSIIRDRNGRAIGLMSSGEDITNRWRVENSLSLRAGQLALINDFIRKTAVLQKPDVVIERTTQLIQKTLGYNHVAIFIPNNQAKKLEMRAVAGDFSEFLPYDFNIPLGHGMVGWVYEHQQKIINNNLDNDQNFVNYFSEGTLIKAALTIPIFLGEEVFGVLDLQSLSENYFDAVDVLIAEIIAGQITMVMDNAQIFDLSQNDLPERSLVLQEANKLDEELEGKVRRRLSKQEEWKGDPSENKNDFIIHWQPDGTIIYLDDNAAKLYNQPCNELLGSNYLSYLQVSEKKEIIQCVFALTPDNPTTVTEYQHIRADGRIYQIQSNDKALFDEAGNLVEVQSRGRDIFEGVQPIREPQKRIEKRPAELKLIDDIIFALDENGRFVDYLLPRQSDMLYLPPESFLGKTFQEVLPPQVVEKINPAFETVLKTRNPSQIEYSIEIAGKERWFSAELTTHWGEQGQPSGITARIRDISNRKWAEEELKLYAKKQKLLNEISKTAMHKFDFQELVQILADCLRELLNADGGNITLWDEERGQVVSGALYDPTSGSYTAAVTTDPGERTLTEAVLTSGSPMVIEDIPKTDLIDQRWKNILPIQSGLALPLLINGKKLGAAMLTFCNPHVFTSEEIELAELAARQIALAILRVEMRDLKEERYRLSTTLQEIGRALSITKDIDTMLDTILELISHIIPYDGASIMEICDGHARILRDRGYNFSDKGEMDFIRLREWEIEKTTSLRRIFQTKKPQFISSMQDDPDWIAISKLPIRSWVGAPVIFENEVVALLILEKVDVGFYQQRHAEYLVAFAEQASLALKIAQYYQWAKETAVLQERSRMARDLHDAVSQSLFSLTYFIQAARKQLQDGSEMNQMAVNLNEIDINARKAIREMRLLLFELQPDESVRKGLVEALQYRLDAVEKRAGILTTINIVNKITLPPILEEDLYYLAEEALNNILKHSCADTISVKLESKTNRFIMEISDNGEGFNPDELNDQGGLGLKNMQERVKAHDGTLNIISQPGNGTTIQVVVPIIT